MVCPNCGSTVAKENLAGQDVDICPSCGGMWCPTNNIGWYIRLHLQSKRPIKPERIANSAESRSAQDHQSTPDRSIQSEAHEDTLRATGTTRNNSRTCPSCGTSMDKFSYDPDSKIFLERCVACGGIWIDADKLGSIIDYLKPPILRPAKHAHQSLLMGNTHSQESNDEDKQEFETSEETKYFDEMKVPLIRRILGIPCVERNLSITPWVTAVIIAINVILYFFLIDSAPDGRAVFSRLGFVPARIFNDPQGALFTFFSSMFMHGSIGHLVGNMVFFWLFGSRIEEDYGHKVFILFYLISGVVAGLMHTVFNFGSVIPVVGASGAISGILGAFFVLHPKNRVIFYIFVLVPISVPAAVYLGFWFGVQILNSIVAANVGGTGIAWFAHIGGFVAGVMMAYPLRSSNSAIARQISQAA